MSRAYMGLAIVRYEVSEMSCNLPRNCQPAMGSDIERMISLNGVVEWCTEKFCSHFLSNVSDFVNKI